ncbi:MAG: ferritin [Syntrophomonadaceae bacterium]|nr:ferritin [Syntrophomonadaceae bacterium]MDD4548571.1 ferritin [Syntrophomonadaceae bacterium]
MIKTEIQDAINEQINAELYSAYLYASMGAFFESLNLKGFANWMNVQYQEEVAHATRMYNYLNERGGRVILKAIDAPPTEWNSPVNVFEEVYKHEQKVTELINNLVDLSMGLKDHATYNFLQWFVAEQVEEEASADEILQQLKLLADNTGALFMIDRELGQRVFVDPNATPKA